MDKQTIDYMAADFIDNGADLIEDPGSWITHKQKKGNQYCSYGALLYANRGLYKNNEVRRRAYRTLADLVDPDPKHMVVNDYCRINIGRIIWWNDRQEETERGHQIVLDAFRKAAKKLRGGPDE